MLSFNCFIGLLAQLVRANNADVEDSIPLRATWTRGASLVFSSFLLSFFFLFSFYSGSVCFIFFTSMYVYISECPFLSAGVSHQRGRKWTKAVEWDHWLTVIREERLLEHKHQSNLILTDFWRSANKKENKKARNPVWPRSDRRRVVAGNQNYTAHNYVIHPRGNSIM